MYNIYSIVILILFDIPRFSVNDLHQIQVAAPSPSSSIITRKTIDSPKFDNDKLEQYSRRLNLTFEGISEAVGAAEIENELICIINNQMKMTPRRFRKLSACTKIGRQVAMDAPRTVIVRLKCDRRRDAIYKYRGNLKTNSTTLVSNRIFEN